MSFNDGSNCLVSSQHAIHRSELTKQRQALADHLTKSSKDSEMQRLLGAKMRAELALHDSERRLAQARSEMTERTTGEQTWRLVEAARDQHELRGEVEIKQPND